MTQQNLEKYQSEKVSVQLERKPNCLVSLTVKASPEIVQQARSMAIKSLAKEISMPGFRQGKIPEEILLKKYPQAFKKTWEKTIADLAFQETIRTTHVFPLSEKTTVSFETKHFTLDEGAEISFHFETFPVIPTIDLSKFSLQIKAIKKITDKEVDEAIRQSQFFYAQWKEITDRPVKEGDYVILDIEMMDPYQKVFSDTRFEVSDKGMAQWLKTLVVGAKVHDQLKGVSEPDADAPEKEKQTFQPKKVTVTVKKIEEGILPELNDEFAKKMGSQNITQLRDSVSKLLQAQIDKNMEEEQREQVNAFLLKEAQFDLPLSLLSSEKQHRIAQMMQIPYLKKQFEEMNKEQKELYEKKIVEEAEKAIRLFYIAQKIIEDRKITISQEEILEEEKKLRSATKQEEKKDIVHALAYSHLILKKVQDHILAKARIKQKP